jgi:hypothetical protein
MRYIITQTQLHSIIYKYLDEKFSESDGKKIVNPHNRDAYRIALLPNTGNGGITYYFFGSGEFDDAYFGMETRKHYGIGHLHIHPDIVETIRLMVSIRETKVMDVVADWFSEKFDVDIDEVSIYPKRKNTPVY